MEDLYPDVVLEHHRAPHNARVLEPCTHRAEAHNPLCGDDVVVTLRVEGGCVREVCCLARGCALCRASGSLLTLVCRGLSVDESRRESAALRAGCQAPGAATPATLLEPLLGVRSAPSRVACVTLPWQALEDALSGAPTD